MIVLSGAEAKAALILRKEVLAVLHAVVQSTIKIQSHIRKYLLHSKFCEYLFMKKKAVDTLLRATRIFLSRKYLKLLRKQQFSEWEQLWDSGHQIFYYYNNMTKKSQYGEPVDEEGVAIPYRPMVRDRLSAVLIQSWPYLESSYDSSYIRPLPSPSLGSMSTMAMASLATCGACKTRKSIRLCKDCVNANNDDNQSLFSNEFIMYGFPYCFTCYMKEHRDDNNKSSHFYELIQSNQIASLEDTISGNGSGLLLIQGGNEDQSDFNKTNSSIPNSYLHCCLCDEPACRKCLNLIDDHQVAEICSILKKMDINEWMNTLKQYNIGGDRKLSLMFDQIVQQNESNDSNNSNEMSMSSPMKHISVEERIDQIRIALEKSRSECDDCYCHNCYQDVHNTGKRMLHRWNGFQIYSSPCDSCQNSPGERVCIDCNNSNYCEVCYRVYHNQGKKRKHRSKLLYEQLPPNGGGYCQICQRRVGDVVCENHERKCYVMTCDSCYLFRHKSNCEKDPSKVKVKSNAKLVEVANDTAALESMICVSCSEPADQKCIQCSDFYCSSTTLEGPNGEMMNCFEFFHSKGNRTSHTCEILNVRKAKKMLKQNNKQKSFANKSTKSSLNNQRKK
eukprot:gene4654-6540_t